MTQLHTKYRPQALSDLVGQSFVKKALTGTLTTGRIASGYMLTGGRGTGKTSTARILAKSLNCETGITPEPCGQCSSCKAFESGFHIDTIEIDAASNSGVDAIREQRQSLYTNPHGRYKVLIIDECHMLSTSAQNALLTVLEEPPEHVVIIFCTTEPHKVLPTIQSRCQEFTFNQAPLNDLVQLLSSICEAEEISISEEALKVVAQTSNGGLRDAQTLLATLHNLDRQIDASDVYEALGSASPGAVTPLLFAIETSNPKHTIKQLQGLLDAVNGDVLFDTLLSLYRDLYVIASTGRTEYASCTPDTAQRLQTIRSDARSIEAKLAVLSESSITLRQLPQTQVNTWFEILCLRLAQMATPKQIARQANVAQPEPLQRETPLTARRVQLNPSASGTDSATFDPDVVHGYLPEPLQSEISVDWVKAGYLSVPNTETAVALQRYVPNIYESYTKAGFKLAQMEIRVSG